MFSFSGLVFLLTAALIPFLSPRVRGNSPLTRSVAVIVILRQITTYLQITIGPLPTVYGDPIAFNNYAFRDPSAALLYQNTYANFLRSVYDIFGGSHLLGCEINQIGFSLALLVEIEILYYLGREEETPKLILFFGLLPSVVLNTSVVLREGWQTACFLGCVLEMLLIRRDGLKPRSLLIIFFAASLVFLQNGFAPFLIIVLPISILWAGRSRPILLVPALVIGMFLVVHFGQRVLDKMTAESDVLRNVAAGRGLEYVEEYAKKVELGRSAFETSLDFSSLRSLAATGPVVLTQYLFSPLPWQLRGTLDYYGLFESMFRLILFACALRAIAKARGEDRAALLYIFFMFLSLETVWAAGTANWGTAFRHRIPAWGLLLALGGPSLLGSKGARLGVRQKRRQNHMKSAPEENRNQQELLTPRARARARGRRARQSPTGEGGDNPSLERKGL